MSKELHTALSNYLSQDKTYGECLACSYKGNFIELNVFSSDGYTGIITTPKNRLKHHGSIDLLACPNCGALKTTFNGLLRK